MRGMGAPLVLFYIIRVSYSYRLRLQLRDCVRLRLNTLKNASHGNDGGEIVEKTRDLRGIDTANGKQPSSDFTRFIF
jgi:hypothetical protein